jgi:sugar lactone lactonase YvrE
MAVDASGCIYLADYGNYCVRKVDENGIISTIAGSGGIGGSAVEGVSALLARFTLLNGVALDTSGNFYVTDQNNFRVRRVIAGGTVNTVAGTGVKGYSGDTGFGIYAEVGTPFGVVVDTAGNIYFSDETEQRIRKVNTAGIISTVAGNGVYGDTGDGGLATSAEINYPTGMTMDASGNLYFAEFNGNRIRKISTSGFISTIAGNGTAGFLGDGAKATLAELSAPYGVAVDSSGNVFIADEDNNRIRKVDTSGKISTVVGNGTAGYLGDGGLAISAEISAPWGVCVDAQDNLLIADAGNYRIRKVFLH